MKVTESIGKRRLKDSKVFTRQGCLHSGREENKSEQREKEARREGRYKKEKVLYYLAGS